VTAVVHPTLPNLVARLALLQSELRDLRRDLDRVIENPVALFEPDHPVVYAGDEDDWGTAA